MQRWLGWTGALVAIAEGIGDGVAVRVEADIIDGPAIDGDGTNAFSGDRGALAHAVFEATQDADARSQRRPSVGLFGVVGEAMNQLDARVAALPAKQRDAATLGAQIDGDEGALVRRRERSLMCVVGEDLRLIAGRPR